MFQIYLPTLDILDIYSDVVCSHAPLYLYLDLASSQVSLSVVIPESAREGIVIVTLPSVWPVEACDLRCAATSGIDIGRFTIQQIDDLHCSPTSECAARVFTDVVAPVRYRSRTRSIIAVKQDVHGLHGRSLQQQQTCESHHQDDHFGPECCHDC